MKVRKLGIATKIFITVIALLVISDLVIGISLYHRSKNVLVTQIKENAMNIDRCVAASVDGKKLDAVHEGDEGSDEYADVLKSLSLFLDNSGVEYVYTIRESAGGGTEFVVDSDPEEPGMPGDEFESSDEISQALAGDTTVDAEPYTDQWGTHISAYSPVYADDTVVGLAVVDLSVDWVNQQTRQILVLIIVICVIVLIVGIAILFVISRSLRHGFVTLNDKIVELVKGDGDLTKQIELTSGDEFEVIGSNVNDLVQYIRGILLHIFKDSDSLQEASEEIAGDMTKSQEDAADVSSAMEQLSAAMEQTSTSIGQIYDLLTTVTDGFQGIAGKIDDGSDFSHTMKSDAEDIGKRAVSEQKNANIRMAEMEKTMQMRIESSKAVEQIQMLTDNIIDITDLTNLLSLNASIEAARAGEAGKGFAVVATEIGQLAQNSANTATKIQEVSSTVIAAVNDLAKEAGEMIKFINETAMKGYGDLVDTSGEYSKSAERIDEIMQECAQLSNSIKKNIDEIDSFTLSVKEAVSESSKAVAEAAERTTDLSSHLLHIGEEADSSHNMTDDLFEEVNHFKL